MRGTSLGQDWDKRFSGTREVFFKNREKSMKIDCKRRRINHLHFSQGHEKRVKKVEKCRRFDQQLGARPLVTARGSDRTPQS